jgi:hypothetical protein
MPFIQHTRGEISPVRFVLRIPICFTVKSLILLYFEHTRGHLNDYDSAVSVTPFFLLGRLYTVIILDIAIVIV